MLGYRATVLESTTFPILYPHMHYVLRSLLAACIALLFPFLSAAQFTDDFTDGDFSASPVWSGSTTQFTVVADAGNNRLRSNSPVAATYQLTTPSTLASNARWEWFADLRFATSGATYADIYLISDNADISLAQNGWFVRMGGTADVVELFKRVAGANTSMLVSPAGILNSSNPFKIRVERTTANEWTLFFDDGNTGTFASAGPVTDAAIATARILEFLSFRAPWARTATSLMTSSWASYPWTLRHRPL